MLKRIANKFVLAFYIFRGGDLVMVDVYVAMIILGRRTLEVVPKRIRDDVKAELDVLGIDGEGNPIIVE